MSNDNQQNRSDREPSKKFPIGKFGLEVALRNNQQPIFGPTQTKLRGRFSASNVVGFSMSEQLSRLIQKFPVIKGLFIEIDTAERTLRIYDPYRGTEQGAREWKELSKLIDDVPVVGSYGMQPYEELLIKGELATDNKLKDWFYTCCKWVANGKAIPFDGDGYSKWPDPKDVDRMPGSRVTNRFGELGWNRRELVG